MADVYIIEFWVSNIETSKTMVCSDTLPEAIKEAVKRKGTDNYKEIKAVYKLIPDSEWEGL